MARIYLALDLRKTDGRGVNADTLAEALEDELPTEIDVDGTVYDVTVLGVGASLAALNESTQLRRDQQRAFDKGLGQ